jgi:3-methyladenine DNA glycosylase Tag
MNRNLVGITYGRFCIKFLQSRMKGEQHRQKLNTEPSIGASHQVSVHLAKQLQRRNV